MKNFLKFTLVGLFLSGLVEFLRIGVANQDIAGFLPVIFIVYPAYLTIVYLLGKIIDRTQKEKRRADLIYFLIFGFIWLMFEWFIMGLAPWNAPSGGIDIILLSSFFQTGMFFFGATVAFAPRIFISDTPKDTKLQKIFLKFYIPFFILSYIITLLSPVEVKYPVAIVLTIIAHLVIGVFYIRHFKCLFYKKKAVEQNHE